MFLELSLLNSFHKRWFPMSCLGVQVVFDYNFCLLYTSISRIQRFPCVVLCEALLWSVDSYFLDFAVSGLPSSSVHKTNLFQRCDDLDIFMTLNLDDLDLYTGALGCSTLVMEFFSIFIRILGRSLLLLYEGFICNIKTWNVCDGSECETVLSASLFSRIWNPFAVTPWIVNMFCHPLDCKHVLSPPWIVNMFCQPLGLWTCSVTPWIVNMLICRKKCCVLLKFVKARNECVI